MKIEPESLRGKTIKIVVNHNIKKGDLNFVPEYKTIGYKKDDVASAVAWLKDEIEKHSCSSPELKYITIMQLINTAFEDVVKENETGLSKE